MRVNDNFDFDPITDEERAGMRALQAEAMEEGRQMVEEWQWHLDQGEPAGERYNRELMAGW